jgi:dienelactone hydrolase
MTRVGDAPAGVPFGSMRSPVALTLRAQGEKGLAAAATAQRSLAAPGVTYRALDQDGLKGGWYLPAGAGPHPVVIVLGGSGGGADFARAALYASHGYAALALAYFGVPGLPRALVNIPLEYFGRAIAHAQSALRPKNGFIAVDGISRGGELALLVGATYPAVRAVIGTMAGGLVMGAFGEPEPGDDRVPAAWTLDGKPVPDLFTGNTNVDWSTSDPAVSQVPGYLAAMRDEAAVERATIAVERIRGPVLLITGKDDRLAPRFELAEIARRRLERNRHPWRYQHLSYDDAGHAIEPPFVPTTTDAFVHPVSKEKMALGGTAAGRAHANADFWPKTLAFLAEAAGRS